MYKASNKFVLDTLDKFPRQPAFHPGSEQLEKLGDIAVFRAGWGIPLRNEDILIFAQLRGHTDLVALSESLNATGFANGYYSPFTVNHRSAEVQRWHVIYATELTRRVMEARGWDSLDILILGTSTSDLSLLDNVRAELKAYGLNVDQIKLYVQACNSAIAGITDICRDEAYHGKRAVVVGFETLTGDATNQDDLNTVRIFGNGGGSIAFIPGQEIQHIVGRTVVEYDTEGVILSPQSCPVYDIPDTDRRPLLPWYEIIGDATPQHFAVTDYGVMVQLPPSQSNKLIMNGIATLAYFAKRIPPLATQVLQTYRTHFRQQYGELSTLFGHQPSLPVVTFINHDLVRLALEERGIDRRTARRMAKRQTPAEIADELGLRDFQPLQIPWVMDRAGFNNISAGTSLAALVTMFAENLIRPNHPLPVLGYGIGSVVQADVWQFVVK